MAEWPPRVDDDVDESQEALATWRRARAKEALAACQAKLVRVPIARTVMVPVV
jgi:hypothetical protein